jgi:putative FmdB family regulatory protein
LQRATISSIEIPVARFSSAAATGEPYRGGAVEAGLSRSAAIIPRPVPIYEYKCTNGHVFDVIQRMSDEALTECQECGAPAVRVLHPVAVHFKGSGFYNTDYGKKKKGAAANGGSSEGSGESKGSGEGSGESKGSESKSSDSKSSGESKPKASTANE